MSQIWKIIFLFFVPFFPLFLHSQTNSIPTIAVLSPSDPIMERGLMLMQQQQYQAAILEFSSVAKNYPRDLRREESLFQVAECYRLLGRDSDALNAYLYVEKSNPKTLYLSQLQIHLGLLYGKLEKYTEAIPYLQKATENPPEEFRSLLRYALGLAFLRNQQPDSAIPLLKSVVEAPSPYQSLAAWALADHYEKKGKTNEALSYWKQLSDLSSETPLKAQATARAGWILFQQEKPLEARPLFEKTRKYEKSGDWRKMANTGLIQIAYQEQKFDEVVKLFKEERQNFLDVRRGEIFFMAGFSHYKIQNFEQAVEVLGLFLKSFSSSPQAPLAAYTKLLAAIQVDPKTTSSETAAFLSKFPQSEFTSSVKLLRAQDFSARKKFTESIPMWEELKALNDSKLPREQILFERARAHYEYQSWMKSAEAFTDYLNEFSQGIQNFQARLSKAVALQQARKNSIEAWEDVRKFAPQPSTQHQMALEQIGLLAAQAQSQEKMATTFRELIGRYPESEVIPLAFFQLASIAMQEGQKSKAVELFDQARKRDPKSWDFAATQRMVYLAYDLKRADETFKLLSEYEALASRNPKSEIMPAAIYYWLGQVHFEQKKFQQAVTFFAAVNGHPQPGELKNPSWWYMAESQREAGIWKFAIASYERFQKLEPLKGQSNEFLLALAQAHLGAKNWNECQTLAEKVMLQDPEGKASAQARFLAGECHEGGKDFAAAAKSFSALAVLYQDPYWTPRAMYRASLAFAKVGDSVSAQAWSDKLQKAYPDFKK